MEKKIITSNPSFSLRYFSSLAVFSEARPEKNFRLGLLLIYHQQCFQLCLGLMELCFSCFAANNWLDLQEVTLASTTHSLVNAGIDWLPDTTAAVINPVPAASEIIG